MSTTPHHHDPKTTTTGGRGTFHTTLLVTERWRPLIADRSPGGASVPTASDPALGGDDSVICCAACGTGFDPTRSRWLCPACGWKESCCEGEPLTCPSPTHTTTAGPALVGRRLAKPMIGPPRT